MAFVVTSQWPMVSGDSQIAASVCGRCRRTRAQPDRASRRGGTSPARIRSAVACPARLRHAPPDTCAVAAARGAEAAEPVWGRVRAHVIEAACARSGSVRAAAAPDGRVGGLVSRQPVVDAERPPENGLDRPLRNGVPIGLGRPSPPLNGNAASERGRRRRGARGGGTGGSEVLNDPAGRLDAACCSVMSCFVQTCSIPPRT